MIALTLWLACASAPNPSEGPADAGDGGAASGSDSGPADTGGDSGSPTGDSGGDSAGGGGDSGTATVSYDPWPFADEVVSYSPGKGAGFGQDNYPAVVYGPPESPGGGGASLDVLSLGQEGVIVLAFRALDLVDGDGVDLIVFENPFTGWAETGVVGVSEDGETWVEWPCDAQDAAGGYPGCAGVALVNTSSTNGVDATDPAVAGGDLFDLADIGVARARYVRVRDSGANSYSGVSGGFDLDALAAVHAEVW